MVRAMLILIMDVMTDFIFILFFHSASCTLYVVTVERHKGRYSLIDISEKMPFPGKV